jgi:hypothetical protein
MAGNALERQVGARVTAVPGGPTIGGGEDDANDAGHFEGPGLEILVLADG